ncbi:MAG: hypothetical protein R2757_04010 [Draconibacterium sp.]
MKNSLTFLLLSLFLILASCQKDDEYTTGELIAKELQSVIEENDIERVMEFGVEQSWGGTWIIGTYGKNYKFQGQFIYIEGESYNLNNLIKYQIKSKTSESGKEIKFLLLTFY